MKSSKDDSLSAKIAYPYRVGAPTGKNGEVKNINLRKILCGVFGGFVNGFFGGGGGMIVVPTLRSSCGLEEKKAHATAIAVILPITLISGFLSFYGFAEGGEFLLPVTVGSVIGGLIGGLFLKKMKSETINVVFAAVMAAAGIRLAFF